LAVLSLVSAGAAFRDAVLLNALGQLFLALGMVALGLFGAAGLLEQLVLQLFHAGTGVSLFLFQFIDLPLQLTDLFLILHLLLLGLVDECIYIRQYVIFVKSANHAAPEPLFRHFRL